MTAFLGLLALSCCGMASEGDHLRIALFILATRNTQPAALADAVPRDGPTRTRLERGKGFKSSSRQPGTREFTAPSAAPGSGSRHRAGAWPSCLLRYAMEFTPIVPPATSANARPRLRRPDSSTFEEPGGRWALPSDTASSVRRLRRPCFCSVQASRLIGEVTAANFAVIAPS